jgi:hypothetical protein
VATSCHSKDQLVNIVPGVLNYYDLPDLAKLVPGTDTSIVSPAEAGRKTNLDIDIWINRFAVEAFAFYQKLKDKDEID